MVEGSSSIDEMGSNLILIYGPGSGAGKSTLSRSVHKHLEDRGLPVFLVDENQIPQLPEFEPYVKAIEAKKGDDPEILAACCRDFLDNIRDRGGIHVLDSSLPCTDWLVSSGASTASALAFVDDLAGAFEERGFRPLLVYIRGNDERFLERALEDRREGWAEDLAEERTGSRDLQLLLEYFSELREVSGQVFDQWSYGRIEIDTSYCSIPTCRDRILKAISG